jgi:hypothetical protein
MMPSVGHALSQGQTTFAVLIDKEAIHSGNGAAVMRPGSERPDAETVALTPETHKAPDHLAPHRALHLRPASAKIFQNAIIQLYESPDLVYPVLPVTAATEKQFPCAAYETVFQKCSSPPCDAYGFILLVKREIIQVYHTVPTDKAFARNCQAECILLSISTE